LVLLEGHPVALPVTVACVVSQKVERTVAQDLPSRPFAVRSTATMMAVPRARFVARTPTEKANLSAFRLEAAPSLPAHQKKWKAIRRWTRSQLPHWVYLMIPAPYLGLAVGSLRMKRKVQQARPRIFAIAVLLLPSFHVHVFKRYKRISIVTKYRSQARLKSRTSYVDWTFCPSVLYPNCPEFS